MATYGIPPGREELRRQIALRARDWGVAATPDEVIITNGCMEALNLCLRAVARRATRSRSNRRHTSAFCRSSRASA
jgi:DNA-binding transcriptional MocR family regulator